MSLITLSGKKSSGKIFAGKNFRRGKIFVTWPKFNHSPAEIVCWNFSSGKIIRHLSKFSSLFPDEIFPDKVTYHWILMSIVRGGGLRGSYFLQFRSIFCQILQFRTYSGPKKYYLIGPFYAGPNLTLAPFTPALIPPIFNNFPLQPGRK